MSTKKDTFAPLRYKDFRTYVAMRFFFTFANQVQIVVVGFYVYELTKSTFALGLLGIFEAVPAIGIALYGGYISDKSEKRKMLFLIYSAVFISSFIMFVVTHSSMKSYLSTEWILIIIYGMIFCNGVARAFNAPATFTVYANSVPRELYPKASTWSSSSWQMAAILGPAAGGLLYGFSYELTGIPGITSTFLLILLMIGIALWLIVVFLKTYPPVFAPKENIWKSISEGLRFVFQSRLMLGAMSLDLFSVFFGGAVALLPVFAEDILHVGAEGLGIMRAMISAGAVITLLAMSKFSPMGRPWRNLLIAVVGFGLSIICFGLSRNFYLSLACLFLYGAFDSVSVIIRGTVIQLLVPDEMRGRVSSVNSMFISSSNEIGDFESGTVASLIGTVPAVIFGGCMTLLIVVITYWKTKSLVSLSLEDINAIPVKTNRNH